MIKYPNAKINLGLYITEKRPDGYHNIESVFYPIPLRDGLEILIEEGNGSISFEAYGLKIPGEVKDNLVVKAIEKFANKAFNYEVHLHKSIPMGGGLGGGSADAAFALTLLEDFGVRLQSLSMFDQAMQLGSDCGFFVKNEPAFVWGRGEFMKPISLNLSDYYLVLVFPNIHVSTAEAYSGIIPNKNNIQLTETIEKPISSWRGSLFNQFEDSVFKQHHILKEIKEAFYKKGATYASMSGSGATMYGLFKEEEKAKDFQCGFNTKVIKL